MSSRASIDPGPAIMALVGAVLAFIGTVLSIGGLATSLRWQETDGVVVESKFVERDDTFTYGGRHADGSYTYYHMENSNYRWRSAAGDIEAKHYAEFPFFQYRYQVDGETYFSEGISHGSLATFSDLSKHFIVNDYSAGSPVTVYYNPSDPSQAVLYNGVPLEAPLEILLGIGLLVGSWYWAQWLQKKAALESVNQTLQRSVYAGGGMQF